MVRWGHFTRLNRRKFLANLYIPFTAYLHEIWGGYAKFIQKQPPLAGRKIPVIYLTRTNGSQFYINPELIQTVEETPDTVITLVNSKKMIVKDSAKEIAERFVEYRRKTLTPFPSQGSVK